MLFHPVFAVTAQGQPHPLFSLLPLLLMFVVFYFLLIRPQQKKQQDHRNFLKGLEKNQEVVTLGGLHGTIVGLKDDTVSLRIADNVKVEVDKGCISRASCK